VHRYTGLERVELLAKGLGWEVGRLVYQSGGQRVSCSKDSYHIVLYVTKTGHISSARWYHSEKGSLGEVVQSDKSKHAIIANWMTEGENVGI
jgi:hypothetical protein